PGPTGSSPRPTPSASATPAGRRRSTGVVAPSSSIRRCCGATTPSDGPNQVRPVWTKMSTWVRLSSVDEGERRDKSVQCGQTSALGLVEPDHVAGRIPESAVTHPVRLVDRLLDHFGAGGADPLEEGVDVVGREEHRPQQALRQQLADDLL